MVVDIDNLDRKSTDFDLVAFKNEYDSFVEKLEGNWNDQQIHIVISKAHTGSIVDLDTAEENLKTWMATQAFLKDKHVPIHFCSAQTDQAAGKIKAIKTVFTRLAKSIHSAKTFGRTPSANLTDITTSDAAITHFSNLFDTCDTDAKRKTQKQQAIVDLQHLINENFENDAHNERLLGIYSKLQEAKKGGTNNGLFEIVRERGMFRSVVGRTNTYRIMSEMIAKELAEREYNKLNIGSADSVNAPELSGLYKNSGVFSNYHYRGLQLLWSAPTENRLNDKIKKIENKEVQSAARKVFF